MINFIAVFIGGGIGSLLRYLTGIMFSRQNSAILPVATFSVNIISCFIIGFAFSLFLHKSEINPSIKVAITAGFCGGLSTFSTLSVEVLNMMKTGHYIHSIVYILISVIFCLLSTFTGMYIANKLFL